MACNPPPTNKGKSWPYLEYYLGERDEENRKNGKGRHHWSGPESLEWYHGHMLYDTMHGLGDYRWRFLGPDHLDTTYEGWFYNNSLHGYGVMSYPDGRVFSGLYYKNIRWGPGVETHTCLQENVGLWHRYQLIRLAWRPAVPSVAIDLVLNPIGINTITQHRVLLKKNFNTIGEVNSAIELLKQSGCQPLAAAQKWPKLYAKHCTDLSSQLCHVQAFDRAYYKNGINTLIEVTQAMEPGKDSSASDTQIATEKPIYYAWNNNEKIIHMMKHCFTHDEQRDKLLDIKNILSGIRKSFKKPGKHEMDCRSLIMASYLGLISNVATLVNECDVIPDVTDVQGNSTIMYAASKYSHEQCYTIYIMMPWKLGRPLVWDATLSTPLRHILMGYATLFEWDLIHTRGSLKVTECGDQVDIINFLMDAGAEVDIYNDACCTPLAITLLRYALEKRGVAHNAMIQAVLPPPTAVQLPPLPDENILEWQINREGREDREPATNGFPGNTKHNHVKKSSDRENNMFSSRLSISKKKLPGLENIKAADKETTAITDPFAEDKNLYDTINTQYLITVAEAFSKPSTVNPIPNIFEVSDMCKDIEAQIEEETKKVAEKVPKKGNAVKKPLNIPSRDEEFQEKEESSEAVSDPKKQEKLAQIMLTILRLLSRGADPRKVRCPQPSLFIAAVSGCSELILHLVEHGADVNEVYPEVYGYSILDVAVSGPLTKDNLDVIHALLQSGANPDHRLKILEPPSTHVQPDNMMEIVVPGPTLLHAVLARKTENESESTPQLDIRDQLLQLLLQYGCNPITQYKGQSAVEIALNKSLALFEIFLRCPQTDLNAVINESNQTILVKMFYLPFCSTLDLGEKLQMLTNLLLFGADPLIKCRNGEDEYGNLFVFAKSVTSSLKSTPVKASNVPPQGSKGPKKPEKKNDLKSKKSVKDTGNRMKSNEESSADYQQALDLVVECARLLYIRWLQAQLMKELIEIVNKYKHRHWTMILKEHNNKKPVSLWLNVDRCLEIWGALKTTKKKIYNDEKMLKQVLCIIHFYFMRTRVLRYPPITKAWRTPRISSQEKDFIESEVANIMRDHKLATMSTPDLVPAMRQYVTPELLVKEVEKFNVCFECIMPLEAEKIPCDSCKLVSFCSFECMKTNISRINCHPCSIYLQEKYFPTPEEATNSEEILPLN